MTASATPRRAAADTVSPPAFLPALEGLRAVAAIGIIVTHVAFQTGNDTGSLVNQMLGRFDFFVPVFFALSGFLLWRRHHPDTGWRSWSTYYVKRIGRIMPAYWVLVVVVLVAFPVASEPNGPPGVLPVIGNLLLMQNFVPDGLVGGLTHLWSLCVEMFFYLALPLLALAVGRRRRRTRVAAIVAVSSLTYIWPFVAWSGSEINAHIMPWAFVSWFGAGLLAAEVEGWMTERLRQRPDDATVAAVRRWASRRWIWVLFAAAALWIAAIDGPEGLVTAGDGEFARRNLYGLVFAAALIVPWALQPRSRLMESAAMQALGRWSYSIFLWHMAILSLMFPLLGVGQFDGSLWTMALVFVATVVVTIVVSAVSYAVVEDPARRAVNRWWSGRLRDRD
ncbi:MAG TPA: acyltransferase [Candidatus Corynebacterium avicola]|uniref:Acyltransferase n=1 Tax=Candidatus Corynebacterium avicola TaxID=2838527 RepID=A0A9D1UKT0_9CORY|nr:acyltransferase [Candidatus Corynebacterium avicola]